MKLPSILKLIAAIALCLAAGGIGSLFTVNEISGWYVHLAKPVFNPPSWLFGPVWTVLYILMGVSLYMAWTHKAPMRAMVWFFVQLVLNTSWTLVFFGLHSPVLGVVVILGLLVAIIMTGVSFWKVSRTASYLLAPYLLWVLFATLLNVSIVLLN